MSARWSVGECCVLIFGGRAAVDSRVGLEEEKEEEQSLVGRRFETAKGKRQIFLSSRSEDEDGRPGKSVGLVGAVKTAGASPTERGANWQDRPREAKGSRHTNGVRGCGERRRCWVGRW